MKKNDLAVLTALAELGIDVSPKQVSPDIEQTLNQLKKYEKELGIKLDPQILAKYLG